MSKIIVHIDLNAFFVRCEEIKNPSLEGKPVIIGKTGRGGIVSTCSYEARKYGAKSGMPTYQALAKCPNAIMISGDYRYYQEKSNEFFNFVKSYTKLVEAASIDATIMDNSGDEVEDISFYSEEPVVLCTLYFRVKAATYDFVSFSFDENAIFINSAYEEIEGVSRQDYNFNITDDVSTDSRIVALKVPSVLYFFTVFLSEEVMLMCPSFTFLQLKR